MTFDLYQILLLKLPLILMILFLFFLLFALHFFLIKGRWKKELAEGRRLFDEKEIEKARKIFQELLVRAEEGKLPLHAKAMILNELARCSEALEDYEKAKDFCLQELELVERHYGQKDGRLASILDDLVQLHHQMGAEEEAQKYAERLYHLNLELHGETHLNTIISLKNLAELEELLGKDEAAEAHYLQLMETLQLLHGTNHKEVNSIRNDLIDFYKKRGKSKEVIPFLLQEYAVKKMKLGDLDDRVLDILQEVAALYQETEQYEQAAMLYEDLLKKQRKRFESSQPAKLSHFTMLLAEAKRLQGRFEEAEKLFIEAIELEMSKDEPDEDEVMTWENNLASVQIELNHFEEAERRIKKALQSKQERWGENAREVLPFFNNLALLLIRTGRFEEAEEFSEKALAIAQQYPDEKKALKTIVENYILLLDRAGKKEKALQLSAQYLS